MSVICKIFSLTFQLFAQFFGLYTGQWDPSNVLEVINMVVFTFPVIISVIGSDFITMLAVIVLVVLERNSEECAGVWRVAVVVASV